MCFFSHLNNLNRIDSNLKSVPVLTVEYRWEVIGLNHKQQEQHLRQLGYRDDGAEVQHFDLPPEEWRWQKDGPADRGGSMLSAAATQCHMQT